jgi:ABC-type sugar transport system substrate-binding protein
MRKLFSISLVLLLFLCFSVGAMFALAAGEEQKEVKKIWTIAYMPPNQSEPWHVACYEAGKFFAEDLGVKIILLDPNNDPSTQIKMAHDIAPQIDGAVIIPVALEAAKMVDELQRMKRIPIVALDRDVPSEKIDLFIAFDNKEAGRFCARKTVEFLEKKYGEPRGNVVMVTTGLNMVAGIYRREGSLEVLKQYPKIKLLGEVEAVMATTEAAQSQLMALFQTMDRPPDAIVNHILATPVLNALRSKGWLKKRGDPDHVIITTINADYDALQTLKEGYTDFIIDQPNMIYFPLGLYYVVKMLEEGYDVLPKVGDEVTAADVPLDKISSPHGGINVLEKPYWAPGVVSYDPDMKHNGLHIKGGVVGIDNVDAPYWFGNALRIWEKAGL